MNSVAQIIRRRRQRKANKRTSPVAYGIVVTGAVLLTLVVLGLGGVAFVSASSYFGIAGVIPAEPQLLRPAALSAEPTVLLDRDARFVLHRVTNPTGADLPWVRLDELPQSLVQATTVIQDANFENRPGFSTADLSAAVGDAILYGQANFNDPVLLYLARHVLVPLTQLPLDHADRPLTDAVLVMELRRRFSREQLLEWFLNTALYGNGAYGIEAAAQMYLGQSATELSLSESALLAAVPEMPSANPFDQSDEAHRRQLMVLDAMVAYGMLEPDTADGARARIAVQRPVTPTDVIAPHFVQVARRQAEALLTDRGLDGARLVAGGGLRITTALDLNLQYQAECALRTHVTRLSGVDPNFVYATSIGEPCYSAASLPALAPEDIGVSHQLTNGAVTVVRPETGELLAYVGTVDYWNESISGYLDSARFGYQPGSMLRPYVYLTALSQGYTTASMTMDVYGQFEQSSGISYEAVNPDGTYRGPVSLREALVSNAAPPAMQVMNWVGAADVVRTAHRMGLNTLLDGPSSYDVSLVSQGGDVALADLTYSFGVLANGGKMVGSPIVRASERPGFRALDPVAVLRIEDEQGTVLWEYAPQTRETLDPALAYLLNDMMGDRELQAQILGTGNVLDIGRPASVFAGMSADGRDLWTVGYTPQLSVGVWLGNPDRMPTAGMDALRGPAAVWHAVMTYAHDALGLPVRDWGRPASIVDEVVCAVTGLLPNGVCPVVSEIFAAGTQPDRVDSYYQMVEVNRQNGKRATASTPRDLVEQRVYFSYPPEAAEWAVAQGIEVPPTEYDSIGIPAVFGPVAILSPDPLGYVSGVFDIRGNATLPGFEYYQLAFGQGLNPQEWNQIGERIFNPARGALLGRWDTTGLADGLYSLRLTAVSSDQTVQESVIQVTVDNTAPVIALLSPATGEEMQVTGSNPVFEAAVDASDNVRVEEVVYYLDGEVVATVTEQPFTASVVLKALGQHEIWAEAIDAAGNSTLTERVLFAVRRGS